MNRKSFLWALIGLFAIIGVAGVISCQVVGPPPILNYYEYMLKGEETYEGHALDKRLTVEQVEDRVRQYLRDLNDPNLEVKEIIEFTYRFYVVFSEKDTGINAFVGMVDAYTGRMYATHRPDMWWNTKYIGSSYKASRGSPPLDWPSGPMTITKEQAWNAAQSSIDENILGEVAKAGVVETFYGYYTIPILWEGKAVVGLVNINGYTGEVCYEACHGSVIDRVEFK